MARRSNGYRHTAHRIRSAAETARAADGYAANEVRAAGKRRPRRPPAKREIDAPVPDRSAASAGGGSGGRVGGGDDGGKGNKGATAPLGRDDHPDLTPEQRAAARATAKAKRDQAREAEPAIAKAVRKAVKRNGGELVRINPLKSEDSLYAKIQRRMVQFKQFAHDPDAAAGTIRDVVRYRVVLPEDGYWAAATRIGEALKEAGFTQEKRSAGWKREGYKGCHDTFRTKAGMEFEVQFHTAESLKAYKESHNWYKEAQRPTTPDDRRAKLDALIAEAYERVPIPDDVPLV